MDGLPKLVQLVILMADVDDTWPERLELEMTYSTCWYGFACCYAVQVKPYTKQGILRWWNQFCKRRLH
jgi:hypothetical protein